MKSSRPDTVVRPVMSWNEPQMPKTPKELRHWLLKQSSGDLQKTEVLIKKTRGQLSLGSTPSEKRSLSKVVSELQRIRTKIKHDIKRLGG